MVKTAQSASAKKTAEVPIKTRRNGGSSAILKVADAVPRHSKKSGKPKPSVSRKTAQIATQSASSAPNPLRSGFLIHDVSRLRRTAYDQRLKPHGITRAQWWVLANLSRRNCDGISQIELARLLDVGKVTLGGLIDRLEEGGFVIRVPDKLDRRSKRIMRSPEGKALCEYMEVFARAVQEDIMTGISEPEQLVLIEILTKMKHNLIGMDAVPQSTPRSRHKSAPSDESSFE